MRRHGDFHHRAIVEVFAGNIWFFERMAVDINLSVHDPDAVAGSSNHPFDVALRRIERVVKYNDVAASDRLQLIYKLIDEDALLVLKTGEHACALDAHRLI